MDIYDFMIFGGVSLVVGGISMMSIPWALIAAGASLVGLGLFLASRKRSG